MIAKILSVNGSDSTVKFTFDDDSTSTQVIANVPIDNAQQTADFLRDYANAYLAGKVIEAAIQAAPGVVNQDIVL